MDIELFLILSTAYEDVRLPRVVENDEQIKRRLYIKGGIETYLGKQGYQYREESHEWTADKRATDTARHRSQGAKDGWAIRRGKQQKGAKT